MGDQNSCLNPSPRHLISSLHLQDLILLSNRFNFKMLGFFLFTGCVCFAMGASTIQSLVKHEVTFLVANNPGITVEECADKCDAVFVLDNMDDERVTDTRCLNACQDALNGGGDHSGHGHHGHHAAKTTTAMPVTTTETLIPVDMVTSDAPMDPITTVPMDVPMNP